jgi:hypothetical protein
MGSTLSPCMELLLLLFEVTKLYFFVTNTGEPIVTFFLTTLYKMKLLKDSGKILNNKFVLYFVLILALSDLLFLSVAKEYSSVAIFLLTGFVSSFFSKNMMVIMCIAMVVTNILRYGTGIRMNEGFEEEEEDKEEEDKEDEGFDEEKEDKEDEGFDGGKEDKDDKDDEITEEDKKKFSENMEKFESYAPMLNSIDKMMYKIEKLVKS